MLCCNVCGLGSPERNFMKSHALSVKLTVVLLCSLAVPAERVCVPICLFAFAFCADKPFCERNQSNHSVKEIGQLR